MLVQVSGRGYDGQQKDAICDVRGLWQTIHWFRLIGYAYELLRCQDLAIFVVTITADRQTNYFSSAHVHVVITLIIDNPKNMEKFAFYCLTACGGTE